MEEPGSRPNQPQATTPRRLGLAPFLLVGFIALLGLAYLASTNPFGTLPSSEKPADSPVAEAERDKRVRMLRWSPTAVAAIEIDVPAKPMELKQHFDSSLRLIWLKQFDKASQAVARTVEAAKKSGGIASRPYAHSLRLQAFLATQPLSNTKLEPPDSARSMQLMQQQYELLTTLDVENKQRLFAYAKEMGDFYIQVVPNAKLAMNSLAIAASLAKQLPDVSPRDKLYVNATLAHLLQKSGSYEAAKEPYATATEIAKKELPVGDVTRLVLSKERGILFFRLHDLRGALDSLYPLVLAPLAVQDRDDYKYVLYCALIASQALGENQKHTETARAMVAYSKYHFGAESPQYNFAMAEYTAAQHGNKGALDGEVAYKQALEELKLSERLDTGSDARGSAQGESSSSAADDGALPVRPAPQKAQTIPSSSPDPVAKPTAEPVAKPTAEPVAKPGPDPVAKPTAEPVAKPGADLVAKPTAGPVAKPGPDPVAKPVAKPVAPVQPPVVPYGQ